MARPIGSKHGADAAFDITGPIGKDGLAYRFIAYGVNEDYWRNFGRRRETLIAPSLAWYGENTTIQLNYEHRDFISPFDRGTALNSRTNKPLAIPATRRLDEPYNNMWGTSDLMQASIDHRLNEDWKLYAAYSYNTESFSANQLRITAVNPVTGIMTRSNDGTRGSLSNVSYGTSYLQGGFWLGEMRNDVLFGGDAQYRTIYRKDLIRQATPNVFNIYNPVYGLLQPGTTVSASDSDQTDKLGTRALFFQDTLHLTDRLALVGGVRYMEYEQLAGRGRPFMANTDLTGDKALPLGGAILKLTEEVSLYASYTQSLKPTSTIAPLTGGVVVGSNIAPEEGVQWETGVKFDINKRLSGTMALYDIDKKNVLVSQLNTATGLNEFRTAGKVRSRGVEIDVTGRLTDSWSMIGSYGYTDARVTEDPTLDRQGAAERGSEHGLALSGLRLRHGLAGPAPGRRRCALCRRPARRRGEHVRAAVLRRRRRVRDLRDQIPDPAGHLPTERQEPVRQRLLSLRREQSERRNGRRAAGVAVGDGEVLRTGAPRQTIGMLLALASVKQSKIAICVPKLELFVVVRVGVMYESTCT